MKKYFVFFVLLFFVFTLGVKADCNNEDLNEWATKAEVKFTLSSSINEGRLGYAYFLTVEPYREDIKMKVIDGSKQSVEGETFKYTENEKEKSFYGVGCYNNLEEETYTIELYGNAKSECKNQLLKKTTYTVPRFNRMINKEMCAIYPEHELCQVYTNQTKDMDQSTFDKIMDDYNSKMAKKELTLKDHLFKILKYLVYVIVPFAIVSIIYITKMRKYKKEERER